jgi:hypothetical protein
MGEGGRRLGEGAIELTTLCIGVAWSYHDVLVFLLHRSSAHIRNGQSTWLEACGEPATPWGPDWRSEMLTTNLGRNGRTVNELSNGVVEWQLASVFPHLCSRPGQDARRGTMVFGWVYFSESSALR